jgi:hypothetical protein
MARTEIAVTAMSGRVENLTDSADYTAIAGTGSGNGATVSYHDTNLLLIKNDTGGPATVTIGVVQPTAYSDASVTIPDQSISIADTKEYIVQKREIYAQTDGFIYIDADVLVKVLAYSGVL